MVTNLQPTAGGITSDISWSEDDIIECKQIRRSTQSVILARGKLSTLDELAPIEYTGNVHNFESLTPLLMSH